MSNRNISRPYLGAGAASILVALIILVVGVFGALTFLSANDKADMAAKSKQYCTQYYEAETTASQLLNTLSAASGKNGSKSGSKSTYDTDSGTIVVTKADNYVAFRVPINKKQNLCVEANVTNKSVTILTWNVE